MAEISQPGERPWRVFINGKYSHVTYAVTNFEALAKENQRLGNIKAATTSIEIYAANSASD
jgi:hypothetical protein